MWVTIIAGLIEVFGPVLADWLKAFLAHLFTRAAAELPAPETFGGADKAHSALCGKALDLLPRRAVLRRLLVREIRRAGPTPAAAALDELRELAGLAAEE